MASCSNGSVYLMKISCSEIKTIDLKNEITWSDIHYFKNGEKSSCTSVAVYDTDIATVGEDGCINLLNAQSVKVVSKKGIK